MEVDIRHYDMEVSDQILSGQKRQEMLFKKARKSVNPEC